MIEMRFSPFQCLPFRVGEFSGDDDEHVDHRPDAGDDNTEKCQSENQHRDCALCLSDIKPVRTKCSEKKTEQQSNGI